MGEMGDVSKFEEDKIEEALIQNGRWAIRAAQVVGYFPCTVEKGKRLKWKPISLNILYPTAIFIAGIGWFYPYHAILPILEGMMKLHSPTERFANALLSYSQQAISQKFRLRQILSTKSFLKFWQSNLTTLAQLSRTKYLNVFDPDRQGQFHPLFQNVGNRTKWWVWTFWILAFVQFVTMTAILPGEPQLKITLAYWCYTLYFHPAHSVWAVYFPWIYAVAFKAIRHQLDSISARSKKFRGVKVSPASVYPAFEPLKRNLSAESKELVKCDTDVISAIVIPQFHQSTDILTKFSATGADPLRIQVLSLKRQLEARPENSDEIEEIVNCCIEAYYSLDAQVKLYSTEFGQYLMFNILQEIVVILTYSFFMFMWSHKGWYWGIGGSAIPLFLYSMELYMLATAADSLQVEAHKIVNVLNFLPFDSVSSDVQAKVHLLAIKISAAPPKIEPCSYFTLNRNLITSILSALTMYLIVLVQFENADDFHPAQANASIAMTTVQP